MISTRVRCSPRPRASVRVSVKLRFMLRVRVRIIVTFRSNLFYCLDLGIVMLLVSGLGLGYVLG